VSTHTLVSLVSRCFYKYLHTTYITLVSKCSPIPRSRHGARFSSGATVAKHQRSDEESQREERRVHPIYGENLSFDVDHLPHRRGRRRRRRRRLLRARRQRRSLRRRLNRNHHLLPTSNESLRRPTGGDRVVPRQRRRGRAVRTRDRLQRRVLVRRVNQEVSRLILPRRHARRRRRRRATDTAADASRARLTDAPPAIDARVDSRADADDGRHEVRLTSYFPHSGATHARPPPRRRLADTRDDEHRPPPRALHRPARRLARHRVPVLPRDGRAPDEKLRGRSQRAAQGAVPVERPDESEQLEGRTRA